MEDEMAGRLEVVEKLRDQIKELEKEKRDAQRRYKEQVGIPHGRLLSKIKTHGPNSPKLSTLNDKPFTITSNI
jgi:hypothetical protein